MKILKLGTTKECLGSSTDKKAKIKYRWSFGHLKMLNDVLWGLYSIENAKIRYSYGFSFYKMLKVVVAVVLIFKKMLK